MLNSRHWILYVEDNEDDVRLVREVLPRDRFPVAWAPSASVARERLLNEHFDLLLLDHGLPDSNSLLFLEDLQALECHTPVIILTGREDEALTLSALRKGAVRYVLKDAMADTLPTAVTETLDLEHRPAAAGNPEAGMGVRFVKDVADRLHHVLLSTMVEGCLLIDVDGIITFSNEASGRLLGLPSTDLLGRPIIDLFDDASRDAFLDLHRAILRTADPSPAAIEAKVRYAETGPSNADTWVLCSGRSVAPELGRHEAYLLVLTDITELVETRNALRSRLEEMERLQGFFVNREERIIELKSRLRAYETRLGLPVTGLSEETRDELDRRLKPDTAAPHPPHRIQQALLSLLEDLDAARLDLTQANVKLKQLDALKSELISTVSHELRTPLTAIKGSVQNVLDGFLGEIDPRQRQMLEVVLRNSKRLARFIDNLLDLSRMENGTFELRVNRVDLVRVASEAAEEVQPIAHKLHINLRLNLPARPLPVEVDADRMTEVILNLLDNALRFAESTVQLSLREAGKWAEIEVQDNGPGIPSEELAAIFDRFNIVRSRSAKSNTGLGLSIVKGIVEAQKGRVWAQNRDSSDGTGARLIVRIPCRHARTEAATMTVTGMGAVRASTVGDQGGPHKVARAVTGSPRNANDKEAA